MQGQDGQNNNIKLLGSCILDHYMGMSTYCLDHCLPTVKKEDAIM